MATKVWKGFIKFGALSVPVFLNVGAREKKIELHTYHATCKGSAKKPYYCPTCNEMPPNDELFRGYDTGAGIVKLTDEDLEAITPATERTMEISECVKWSEVDPLYLAESFYLLPDDAGKKGYGLLVRALRDSGRVAIAQLTKSNREHIVLVRPRGNGLMLHYIWYQAEIHQVSEFENLQPATLSATEIKLASQLVDNFAGPFQPETYEDGFFQRMNTLIASKLDSAIAAPEPVKNVVHAASQDITAMLTASLAMSKPSRAIKLQDEPLKPKQSQAKGKKKKAA